MVINAVVEVFVLDGDAVPPLVAVVAAAGLGVVVGGGVVGVAVGQKVTVGVVLGFGIGGGGGVVGTAVAMTGGRGVGGRVGSVGRVAVLVAITVAVLVAVAAAATGSDGRGQMMTAVTLRATAKSESAAKIAISRWREPPTTKRSIRAYQACSRARTVSFQSLSGRACGPSFAYNERQNVM